MIPDTFIEYYYGKYKVVDLHNGFIKVNSEEGKGTKIEVFLPNVAI
jgi:signal transduction histidine kinase